jgi:CG-1 domain
VKPAKLMLAEFSLGIVLFSIERAFSKCIYIADGSLYIFNKMVNRYFRNDGHSWQKYGRTLAEGHKRLKVFLPFYHSFIYFYFFHISPPSPSFTSQ